MAMSVGPAAEDDDDEVSSAINTTPLVDVMLVLLIIFLITIPVVTHTVKVKLPSETNVATKTKPENINISVTSDGGIYWNSKLIPDMNGLLDLMKETAVIVPQPEVLIRGDQEARFEGIGKVVYACQRAGILKIGFILQPPPRGG